MADKHSSQYADEVMRLRLTLETISTLGFRADNCVGFVDGAHEKALRAACKLAREALSDEIERGQS